MFNWRRLAVLPLAVLLVANLDSSGHKANAADCGDISIASMNWASAEMIAHIDLLILSVGFGCNATLASGDVMPDFSPEGEAPTVDLYPEIWVNAIQEPLDRAVADGDLFFGAKVLSDGGYEGWWIPKYLSDEHPQIRSVEDALTYPELFELPDDEGISGVHNCPAGWPCQVASAAVIGNRVRLCRNVPSHKSTVGQLMTCTPCTPEIFRRMPGLPSIMCQSVSGVMRL